MNKFQWDIPTSMGYSITVGILAFQNQWIAIFDDLKD